MSFKEHFEGKSLVIFGCGYVGTALAEQAVAGGMKVVALTRNAERASELKEMGVSQVVEADLDSSDWHEQLGENYDFVVNCVSSAGGGIAGYQKSYYEGQRSLLQWAQAGRVGRFLYTSATSVYGYYEGELVGEADVAYEPGTSAEVLVQAEQLIETADCFEAWTILRLAGIYGPMRHHLLNQLKSGATEFAGEGDFYLNLIHLEDICSAIWHCLSFEAENQNQAYNLADGHYATKRAIVEWLAEQVGQPRPVFNPKLVSERSKRRQGKSGSVPNRRIDVRKLRGTGWEPIYVDFRAGYRNLL